MVRKLEKWLRVAFFKPCRLRHMGVAIIVSTALAGTTKNPVRLRQRAAFSTKHLVCWWYPAQSDGNCLVVRELV